MAEAAPHVARIFDLITADFPALVAYVGRDLRYRFANRAYEKWYGRGPGELNGLTVPEGVGAVRYQSVRDKIARVLDGERVRFEINYHERTLDLEYLPDFEPGGVEVRGYVVIAHDTTRQTRHERALIERTKDFSLLTETIPQGIWRCDPDGAADYCSQRFCDLVGYVEADLLGWGWAGLIHADDRARVLVEWQAARDAGGAISIEFRVRVADGRYRWYLSLGNPLRDDHGTIVKYYGTWTDIDEQKRTLLENDQLLQRERQAVRARDEFLSVASHELKTPLTSLKLQSQLVRHLRERGDARAYEPARIDALLTQIDRQVNRLNRLVDDMLDISRIQAGRLRIEPRLIDLAPVIENTTRRVREQNEIPDQVCLDPPASVRVVADPERVSQILESLLSNALRYGEGRPVHVGLTHAGANVILRVRDEGRGIPSEMHARIFERFERVDALGDPSGLGLGLFIARQIVRAHDGEIWVESEVGRGATFCVRLPVAGN